MAALAHLIVFLSAVKLLQLKKDRDWVFLYLISFFEVLLAAGLSFSPVFLGTLTLYLLCGLSTIISFEIQKSRRAIAVSETHLLVPPDSRIFKNAARQSRKGSRINVETGRLPIVALLLLVLIFVLALPLFLVAPRSGGAALSRSGSSLSNFVGFSENVVLGEIGNLKRDDAVVMHVRIEDPQPNLDIRWRGVALDEFTGRGWKKSSEVRRSERIFDGPGFFRLGTTVALNRLTTQTVFLEPIDSPVLFAASRPIAIQGDFAKLRVDGEGSVQVARHQSGRAMYTALSDMTQPDARLLERSAARSGYLQPILATAPKSRSQDRRADKRGHGKRPREQSIRCRQSDRVTSATGLWLQPGDDCRRSRSFGRLSIQRKDRPLRIFFYSHGCNAADAQHSRARGERISSRRIQ